MKRTLLWVALLGLTLTNSAHAADLFVKLVGGCDPCKPNCVRKSCYDDYHPKPLPCTRGPKCWVCPDYCKKCEPKARGVKHFCCPDYCRKPLPKIGCPPSQHLKCSPPVCSHAPRVQHAPQPRRNARPGSVRN